MNLRIFLIILSIVLFVILGAVGAGWITYAHPEALLGFGLASFAGGHLP